MKLVTEEDAAKQAQRESLSEKVEILNNQISDLHQSKTRKFAATDAAINFVIDNPAYFKDLNGGTPDLEVQLDLAYAAIFTFLSRRGAETGVVDKQINAKIDDIKRISKELGRERSGLSNSIFAALAGSDLAI